MKKIITLFALSVLFNLTSCLGPLDFSDYHSSTRVDAALDKLHADYPSLTELVTIGTSIEGLPIRGIKITSSPGTNDPSKGDVVFVACHHAREWMSVETPLYLAMRLLSDYGTNPTVRADLDRVQIWIIPVLNPDGFKHTQTTYRMWRKNRRNNGDGTFGVDLNRNYSYQWGLPGISGSPISSSDVYYGAAPFSEPETAALRNFMLARTNLKAFFTYHAYGEWHMKPWAYTFSNAPGYETLHSIATRNITRIAAVHGHTYKEIFTPYNSSGEATDYWWNERRIAAFTTEVRPEFSDPAGFAPVASEIIPNCEENYPAALAIIHDASLPRVWIKDNAGDTGAEPSAGYTWESPDIWTVPAILNQNATVELHVRVRNSTGATVNNVTLDVYYTDPRITLEFPNPIGTLIGSQVISVPAGGTEVVIPWTTPTGTNSLGERHWCVGAVVKHEDDMPLTTLVRRSSNLACHNFNTTEIVDGSLLTVMATNFLNVAAELDIQINTQELPEDWKIRIPPAEELQIELTPGTLRKAKLLKKQGIILEPGQTIKIPLEVHYSRKTDKEIAVRIEGNLIPLVPGSPAPVGNGYTYFVRTKK